MYGDWRSNNVTVGCIACSALCLNDDGYRIVHTIRRLMGSMREVRDPLAHAVAWRIAEEILRMVPAASEDERSRVRIEIGDRDECVGVRFEPRGSGSDRSWVVKLPARWLEQRVIEHESGPDPLRIWSWGSLYMRLGPGAQGISIHGPDAVLSLTSNGYWLPYWIGRGPFVDGLVCRGQPLAIALARSVFQSFNEFDDIWMRCCAVYGAEFEQNLARTVCLDGCETLAEALHQLHSAMALVLLNGEIE